MAISGPAGKNTWPSMKLTILTTCRKCDEVPCPGTVSGATTSAIGRWASTANYTTTKSRRARMPDEKREGGPPRSTLLVVDAVIEPSVESEWNEWYDGTHLPEILACPHFQSGVRYIRDGGCVRNYLTIYTLSSEEAVRTPEFGKGRGWGAFKEKVRYSTRLYARLESTHE